MLADAPWTTWHKKSWSPQNILPAGMNVLLANAECRNQPPLVSVSPRTQNILLIIPIKWGIMEEVTRMEIASIASVYTLARKGLKIACCYLHPFASWGFAPNPLN